jgi:hypothetical protein
MKFWLILVAFLCLAVVPLAVAESAALESRCSASKHAPRAWLGLRVSKPDDSITAHIPQLPAGTGFVVVSVDTAGPAEAAGVADYDLLWKLGDQMLVNEAQLATLLRLFQPGEEVTLAVFRAGKPIEIKLKLGTAPPPKIPFPGDLVDSSLLPGACGGPMRVVNIAEKSAKFSDDHGSAMVRRSGEGYHVQIIGPNEETAYEGEISKRDGFAAVPEVWQRKIQVLCRSLDQVLDGKADSGREARPRVLPQNAGVH